MMNKKVIAVALALALAGGSYAQDDTAKKKGESLYGVGRPPRHPVELGHPDNNQRICLEYH